MVDVRPAGTVMTEPPRFAWRVDRLDTFKAVLVQRFGRRASEGHNRPQSALGWGWNEARCLWHDHPAPARGCGCGIRSADSLKVLLKYFEGMFIRNPETDPRFRQAVEDQLDAVAERYGIWRAPAAVSRVEMGGRVLPGNPVDDPDGTWRAERLRVVSIHLRDEHDMAEALAQTYDADVYTYDAAEWRARTIELAGSSGCATRD